MSSTVKEVSKGIVKDPSKESALSSTPKQRKSVGSVKFEDDEDEDGTKPDFIYGGPFIKVEKPSIFLDTATPINLPLQGTFKKSFAYYSLKERMPVILTKVIDYCSRESARIKQTTSASDDEVNQYIQFVSKLKSDLITNKKYEKFVANTDEAKKWNEWIDWLDCPSYFTNTWLWTECYVYRRLRDGCEIGPNLHKLDPFEEQKREAFTNGLEPMCMVAEKLPAMLQESPKDKRKQDFITLLKLCLWANRCDSSLSLGEPVILKDPFQMIIDLKDKLLVDDSAKAADQIPNKADAMRKNVDGNTGPVKKCSCHRLATLAGVPICKDETAEAAPPPPAPAPAAAKAPAEAPATPPAPPAPGAPEAAEAPAPSAEPEEPPKPPPCPAKVTVPSAVMFDIVTDNVGYELFTDMCFAHFLVSQKIVQKVRFHVKKYPWFVSDVTAKDISQFLDSCTGANFTKELPPEPKPETKESKTAEPKPEGEEEPPPAPRVLSSDALRDLGAAWRQNFDTGVFIVCSDDYWTYPHGYKDMKKYEPTMYRKLQLACGILFKGDLNYRKLLNERNCNPTLGFEPSLQGFIPAPIIAARTVKSDLICGLPKGKWEAINKIDDKWMQKGDYGTIQYCAKAEALKPDVRPCLDYCKECKGVICPPHTDM